MTIHHRVSTGIALILALATSTARASARLLDLDANGSYVPAFAASRQARTQATASPAASAPPTIVRVTAPDGGFDWGDAGIGAAGGFALSMIGLGAALAASQRRTRRRPTPTG